MTPPVALTPEQEETARRLWVAGATHSEICIAIGVKVDRFRARLNDQLKDLPKRPRGAGSGRRGRDPSPSEIEAWCLALRSSWTEEERMAHL